MHKVVDFLFNNSLYIFLVLPYAFGIVAGIHGHTATQEVLNFGNLAVEPDQRKVATKRYRESLFLAFTFGACALFCSWIVALLIPILYSL